MASHMPEPSHSCEICGLSELSDEGLRTHMTNNHLEGAATCPFCDLGDVTPKEMLIHVNSAHLDYLTPENELIAFIDDDDEDDCAQRTFQDTSPPDVKQQSSLSDLPRSLGSSASSSCSSSSSSGPGPGCGFTGEQGMHGSGSPLRSSLALRLRQDTLPAPNLLQCPLCPHTNTSASRLEEHVNREHLDPLSPSPAMPQAGLCGGNTLDCPLCTASFGNSSDLEMHVNIEHRDILSPQKPMTSHVPRVTSGSNGEGCPICKRTSFACDRDLALHLEEHFQRYDTTPDMITDQLLARAVEEQERDCRRLQEQKEFDMLRAQYGMDNQGNFKEQSVTNMQRAVCAGELTVADYYERKMELRKSENYGIDDQTSCTKGIISKIYSLSSSSSNVLRTYVCTTVDHYASTYGDKGWGCGYRNMQMLLSSLMHHTGYNELMYRDEGGLYGMSSSQRSAMPSISRLQKHIEWAWGLGFDPQGCDQLGGQLHNTRKWIGTTEMVTLLSSLRFRCELVDFHRPTSSDGSHPQLFNWILQYFQKKDDFKPPLYLQHQGHSRTVVGVEVLPRGVNLLVLDPSHAPRQMAQFRDTSSGASALRLIRKASSAMRARQYQLVSVIGVMQSEQEYQHSKILSSTRIPPN